MNEKQSLLTIVFIRLIQHLTSWTLNLNSQHFDLTTFRMLSRSANAIEGKFERFLLTLLMESENALNNFSNAVIYLNRFDK